MAKVDWKDREQVKAYFRERMRVFVQRHKNDPAYKARRKKCNEKFKPRRRELDFINRESRYAKAREWRAKNAERVRATCKKSKAKRKDKTQAEWAKWYSANREYCLNRAREYAVNNKDKRAALYKAWSAKNDRHEWRAKYTELNRDRIRAHNRKRYAKTRGAAEATFTAKEWKEMLQASGMKCHYCKCSVHDTKKRFKEMTKEEIMSKATQDHVIPVSRGGNHVRENIVVACFACNCLKKDSLSFSAAA